MACGEFRQDLDIHLTRLAILGMCNWTYQWYRPDGPQDMDEISGHFADLVVMGARGQSGHHLPLLLTAAGEISADFARIAAVPQDEHDVLVLGMAQRLEHRGPDTVVVVAALEFARHNQVVVVSAADLAWDWVVLAARLACPFTVRAAPAA